MYALVYCICFIHKWNHTIMHFLMIYYFLSYVFKLIYVEFCISFFISSISYSCVIIILKSTHSIDYGNLKSSWFITSKVHVAGNSLTECLILCMCKFLLGYIPINTVAEFRVFKIWWLTPIYFQCIWSTLNSIGMM